MTPSLLALLAWLVCAPGAAAADIATAYVVDASGSTAGHGGSCGDANSDGTADTILDCEIEGLVSLNRSVVPYAPAPSGVIGFGEDATSADVGPGAGFQALTSVDADANGDGTRDIDEVARSLTSTGFSLFTPIGIDTGGTDFDEALGELNALASLTAADMHAAFLSDGSASLSTGPGSPLQGAIDAGIEIDTFSVGTGAAGCSPDSPLRQIADASGGVCTEISDPSHLSQMTWFPPACAREPADLVGTAGVDTLVGTDNPDVAAALAGHDSVTGGAANDLLCGGSGNDTLKGGPGKDTLIGGPGDDVCRGGPGRDQLKSC